MKDMLLEIGCDGGSIKLQSVLIYGTFLFKVQSHEFFETGTNKATTYINIQDAWNALKLRFPSWHQLYLVDIDAQMIDVLKSDYLEVSNKNENTKDRWLEQLIGYGLGF